MNNDQVQDLLTDISEMREEGSTATQILVVVERSLKKALRKGGSNDAPKSPSSIV